MNNQINENSHLFKIPPKYLNPHFIVKHSLNFFEYLEGTSYPLISLLKKRQLGFFTYYFGMVGIRYFLLLNSRHKIHSTFAPCDLGTMFFFPIF
jgi:hypothetical protein